MKSEMAAAAGDDGFGPTNEWGNDRLWTANGDGERRWRTTNDNATTATTEVGSPPNFFPSFFSFLAISLRSAKLVYGNRFRFFAIY